MAGKKVKWISYKRELEYPCTAEASAEISDIITKLRDLEDEFLVVDLN